MTATAIQQGSRWCMRLIYAVIVDLTFPGLLVNPPLTLAADTFALRAQGYLPTLRRRPLKGSFRRKFCLLSFNM